MGESSCYQRGSKIKTLGSIHFRPQRYLNPVPRKALTKQPLPSFFSGVLLALVISTVLSNTRSPQVPAMSLQRWRFLLCLSFAEGDAGCPATAWRVYKHDGQEASFQRPGMAWKLLEMDCPEKIFQWQTTCPRLALLTACWTLLINHPSGKHPADLPTGQSDGSLLSVEAPSSQKTLAHVKLTET